MIKFCMLNNCFAFDGKYYEQVSGTPMGSNLSPILAETLVADIFEQAIASFSKPVKFCRYFVDDSFLIINKNEQDNFFKHINKHVKPLKTIHFTIEKESNGSLKFLDVQATKFRGMITCSVYHKPMHSGRYLDYNSNHSFQTKKAIIKTMINKAIKFCTNEQDYHKEIDLVKSVLIENNYPERLITSIIKQCYEKHYNKDYQVHEFHTSSLVAIPYYDIYSKYLKKELGEYGINTVFKKGITLQSMLYNRNKKPNMDKNNVVYKVPCIDCDYIYIGQTCKKLKFRISQHKCAWTKNHPERSNIAYHALKFNHSVDLENPIILHVENNFRSRIFLESLEIEKAKINKINLMNDKQNSTTCIPPQYLSIYRNT